jgi:hypothetical protein
MAIQEKVLLSTTYFGSVQYFTKFLLYPERIIERFDHYTKQTYRNRCNIYGANGILPLSVPVLKGPQHKTYVRDIRIDHSKNWRKLHWKGIESAYRHSPFFEFYMDDIRAFLGKKYEYLLELNLAILDHLIDSLDIEGGYFLSAKFLESPGKAVRDERDSIHPKKAGIEDPDFRAEPYKQVFADRLGFQENLSLIDLLFNEGPNARSILEKCIRR